MMDSSCGDKARPGLKRARHGIGMGGISRARERHRAKTSCVARIAQWRGRRQVGVGGEERTPSKVFTEAGWVCWEERSRCCRRSPKQTEFRPSFPSMHEMVGVVVDSSLRLNNAMHWTLFRRQVKHSRFAETSQSAAAHVQRRRTPQLKILEEEEERGEVWKSTPSGIHRREGAVVFGCLPVLRLGFQEKNQMPVPVIDLFSLPPRTRATPSAHWIYFSLPPRDSLFDAYPGRLTASPSPAWLHVTAPVSAVHVR